jgi:hypothetical protein
MKVFISWSGERSKAIAEALRDWLPSVIQQAVPFMSKWDIEAGVRWGEKLTAELEETHFGIVCLTPQNMREPWILFESGALSKSLKSKVCTYLYDLKPTDVKAPLSQFNHSQADGEGTKKILRSINTALGDKALLDDSRLNAAFDTWWETLSKKIKAVAEIPEAVPPAERSEKEMIEEILELVRGQSKYAQGDSGWAWLEDAPLAANARRNATTAEILEAALAAIKHGPDGNATQ